MPLSVAPGGYLLDGGKGEALWFSGGLLIYKTTGDQTSGNLAVAEVPAPRGSESPGHRHHHEDEARYTCGSPATALTLPPHDLPPRDALLLAATAAAHGLDILEPS